MSTFLHYFRIFVQHLAGVRLENKQFLSQTQVTPAHSADIRRAALHYLPLEFVAQTPVLEVPDVGGQAGRRSQVSVIEGGLVNGVSVFEGEFSGADV